VCCCLFTYGVNLSELSLTFNFSNVVVAAVCLANHSPELFQVSLMMFSESVILSRLKTIEELFFSKTITEERWCSLLHLQRTPSVPNYKSFQEFWRVNIFQV